MKSSLIVNLALILIFWGMPSVISSNSILTSSSYNCYQQEEELQEEELQEEELLEEEEMQEEEELEETEEVEEEEKQTEEPDELLEMEEPEEDLGEDAPPSEDERMKYFKEKYEFTFQQVLFEDVWNAVKQALIDRNCQLSKESYSQTDEGFYKGSILSDFCVFATGHDSTMDYLELYSIQVPVIRGGTWATGRFQYKFIIREQDDGTVYVRLKGEVSGFEDYVTTQVHFWDSNGYLESMMLKQIRKNVGEGGEDNDE